MEQLRFSGQGGNPAISYRRLIDAGAHGEVHEVRYSTHFPIDRSFTTVVAIRCVTTLSIVVAAYVDSQLFARKIIRLFGDAQRRKEITEAIENEARAIAKLCVPGIHPNIVAVLRSGEVKDTALYYIDMELCDWNLEQFIDQHRPTSEAPFTIEQLWGIMTHIASGITFIHDEGLVHRDLKPRNGIQLG